MIMVSFSVSFYTKTPLKSTIGNLSSIRPISNEFSLERVVKLWNPGLSEKTALGFVEFLKPMLEYRPKDRRTARQMLDGAWLQ